MSVRIVFLELDGVLTNLTFYRKNPGADQTTLDPKNLASMNELLAWTQAKVVISSEWRFKLNLLDLRRKLTDQGLDGDIISRTPELPGRERWEEIRAWLDFTKYPIDRFVILDDRDMGPLESNLVRVLFSTGLGHEEVKRAARILLA